MDSSLSPERGREGGSEGGGKEEGVEVGAVATNSSGCERSRQQVHKECERKVLCVMHRSCSCSLANMPKHKNGS